MDLEPGNPIKALAVVAAIIALAMHLGLAGPPAGAEPAARPVDADVTGAARP